MSTMKIMKSPLKQDEKCWGCNQVLPKGSEATMHLESNKKEEGGRAIDKSYWCDCCAAFSAKFGAAYEHGIEEGELNESPLYKRFKSDFEKANK